MKRYIALFCLSLALISCHSSRQLVVTKANDRIITSHGRTVYDTNNDLVLITAASYAEFKFSGDSCIVYLQNKTYPGDYNYVAIELDNIYKGRLKVDGTEPKPYIINATTLANVHTLRIYKATEASNGNVVLTEIKAAWLKAVKQPKQKTIEFIGNSITAGMANDTKDIPCGTGKWYDQHNAYWAYGPILARALKVDFMLSAVSGIGIYRNWNSNGPTMPQVYENSFLNTDSTQRWDFSRYSPDIVSIALGTNDFSDGDGRSERLPFDSAIFIRNYVSFIGTVYRHYPNTQIALLTSPMLNGARRDLHFACLQSIKKKVTILYPDKQPVEIFQFQPMIPKGCSYHPDLADHEILAREVQPFFERLLAK
jgi:lysophospholipase L1-like esterase